MNEELQSSNEEMETSREELQSMNEELSTINQELHTKIEMESKTNSDLVNLFEATNIPTLFLSNDLRIRRFTPQISMFFHLLDLDMGRPIEDIVQKIELEGFIRDIQLVKSTRKRHEREICAAGKCFILRIAPYQTPDNKIDGSVITFFDITSLKTAQRELQERTTELEALLQAIPDSYFRLDRHLTILSFKPGNAPPPTFDLKMIGRKLDDLFRDEALKKMKEAVREVEKSGALVTVDYWLDEQDGRRFFEARLVPVLEEQTLVIVRDMTDLKKAEAEAIEARQAAETANRAKSEFLANMSHEIRTPMNGLLGMNELALSEDIPPSAREYLLYARQAGKALLGIINDILDLSKIESGKANLSVKPFRLRANLDSILSPLAICAKRKGLGLHHDVDADVPDNLIGDRGRLRQVLTNLVGNAIKFTGKGAVRLSVAVDSRPVPPNSPDSVVLLFQVQDQGIGIPKDKLEEIFDAFSQVGLSSHVNYGGTGLGLAISKNLVEMMNGRIWAVSAIGKGSTFYFTATFGLGGEEAQPENNMQPASRPYGPFRILLAEDDELNRILTVKLLKKRGHHVEVAENGRAALEKLKAKKFDLVFMDVRMPVMDGVKAVQGIRRGEAGKQNVSIPVVAMTAHALQGDRERFMAEGMDDYLSKPIDLGELDRVLAGIIVQLRKENNST